MIKTIFILVFLVLTSCARDRIPPPVINTGKEFRIYLFAAGYCEPCKEELPEIRDWYAKKPKDKIHIIVYLIGGDTTGQQPTEQYANEFGERLHLPFAMRADRFARFYKTFYDSGTGVPATVVTDRDGNVLRVFAPRRITLGELDAVIGG